MTGNLNLQNETAMMLNRQIRDLRLNESKLRQRIDELDKLLSTRQSDSLSQLEEQDQLKQ